MSPRFWLVMTALVGTPAGAGEEGAVDLPELVRRADLVLVGRVEGEVSRWTPDHASIYTDVALRVSRSVKDRDAGDLRAGDRLMVRREGGVVEGVERRFPGGVRFVPDEEIVIFLERRAGAWWTVAGEQGKLPVTEAFGRKVVRRVPPPQEIQRPPRGGPALRPLDELIQEITRELSRVGNLATRR